MTPREINQLNIAEFLAAVNVFPERKFNGYWMYKTPWQDQNTGSLKVDLNKGLWIDFSTHEGGSLIDLILKIYPALSVKDIVRKFNNGDFSFHPLDFSVDCNKKPQSEEHLEARQVLEYPKLCGYLKCRGIDPVIASKYINVYHYVHDGRRYCNLGAPNHSGGYNLFSKGFKRATKQGYTLYENSKCSSRIYFEGVMDFLSFLMIYPDQENQHEYCILNTVNNLRKSFESLRMKPKTFSFLDNDEAGNKATQRLREHATEEGSIFYDYRKTYKEFKDLNDYLIAGRERF